MNRLVARWMRRPRPSLVDLHSTPRYGVCCIPKADITSILATFGRIPGHDKEVELDENIKENHDMPGLEFGFREIGPLPAPANNVDTKSHCEVEGSIRDDA